MLAYIALGGNVGAVDATFHRSLNDLNARPGISVARVSSFILTEPMGAASGDSFLNAAAELETDLPPLDLLDALQAVETAHLRVRAKHWGPRTLDLDVLLYGTEVVNDPRLIIPHPGSWYRRFVLDPLAEIAPTVMHPLKFLTIEELRSRLLQRPLPVGICGGKSRERQELLEEIRARFPEVHARSWMSDDADPLALLFWLGEPRDQDFPMRGRREPALQDLGQTRDQDPAFEDLPVLPRLDLTAFPDDPHSAVNHVLTAALG